MTSWHPSVWQVPRCRTMACQAPFSHLTSEISAPWRHLCWELSKQHWNLLPWLSMVSNQHSPHCQREMGVLEAAQWQILNVGFFSDCNPASIPTVQSALCRWRLSAADSYVLSSPRLLLVHNYDCWLFFEKVTSRPLRYIFHHMPRQLVSARAVICCYGFPIFSMGCLLRKVKSDWRAI